MLARRSAAFQHAGMNRPYSEFLWGTVSLRARGSSLRGRSPSGPEPEPEANRSLLLFIHSFFKHLAGQVDISLTIIGNEGGQGLEIHIILIGR